MNWLKEVSYFGSVGLSFSFSVFIGLFLGIWLDKVLDTGPVLTFIGLLFGIAAGYRTIAKLIRKIRKF